MKQPVLHIYHQERPGWDVTIAGGREALALLCDALNEILEQGESRTDLSVKTSDGTGYRVVVFDAGDIVENEEAAPPYAPYEEVGDTVRIIWDEHRKRYSR